MSNPKDLNSPSPWNMRIWDEAKHQWLCDGEDDVLPYYGFDIRGGEVTAMQSMDWVYRQFEHGRKLIWERSTGLTDKNGKEIYEGDILGGMLEGCYIGWCDTTKSFEVFNCYEHYCMACDGDILWCELSDSDIDLEVIGNIHENPELLESK